MLEHCIRLQIFLIIFIIWFDSALSISKNIIFLNRYFRSIICNEWHPQSLHAQSFKREDKRRKMRNHELYFEVVDQTDRKETRKSNITRHLRPGRTGWLLKKYEILCYHYGILPYRFSWLFLWIRSPAHDFYIGAHFSPIDTAAVL